MFAWDGAWAPLRTPATRNKTTMAKTIGRLTATTWIRAELKPGLHSDGANLYLRVGKDGNRSWVSFTVSAAASAKPVLARRLAKPARVRLASRSLKPAARPRKAARYLNSKPKVDPLTVWRETPETDAKTFAHVAEEYIALNTARWRSAKHATQWRTTIAKYCKPLMKVPVDQIDGQMVRQMLTPIWTHSRDRVAIARSHRDGDRFWQRR